MDLVDGSAIALLLEAPPAADGLSDDEAIRPASSEQLDALLDGVEIGRLPPSLDRFIRDPEPRRRIRSVTACYLDLGEVVVPVDGGGVLLHILSDQQWVLHWLVFVAPDGSGGPVVVTSVPFGFPSAGDGPPRFDPRVADPELPDLPAVCADSVDEFLIRFWLENEAWHAVNPTIDGDARWTPLLETHLAQLRDRTT
jgi:hypothetical protein